MKLARGFKDDEESASRDGTGVYNGKYGKTKHSYLDPDDIHARKRQETPAQIPERRQIQTGKAKVADSRMVEQARVLLR